MFKKRHQQIDELTANIFSTLEKAKRRRQKKLLEKLGKSIAKQLQNHCTKAATILVQKYLAKIDSDTPAQMKEDYEKEIADLVFNKKVSLKLSPQEGIDSNELSQFSIASPIMSEAEAVEEVSHDEMPEEIKPNKVADPILIPVSESQSDSFSASESVSGDSTYQKPKPQAQNINSLSKTNQKLNQYKLLQVTQVSQDDAFRQDPDQQSEAEKKEEKKRVSVSLDWLDDQFLFMLETFLLALPIQKVQSASLNNIKHMFRHQTLNQKSFCLVKINPKDAMPSLMQSPISLDSWVSNTNPYNQAQKKLQPRYITFGFGKIQEIKEITQIHEGDWAQNGMQVYNETLSKVGRFLEQRHFFSYQVWRSRLIVIGGQTTRGHALNTVEVADCCGERGSPVVVSQTLPKLNQRRYLHQSLIIDNKFLFVFFGMKSSVKLSSIIEFMDLSAKHKSFQIAKLKQNTMLNSNNLFDRALFLQKKGGSLETGTELIILGGFRGDNYHSDLGSNYSLPFSLQLRVSYNVQNQPLGLTQSTNPICEYAIQALPKDKAVEIPTTAQFLQNTNVFCTIARAVNEKFYALTSEQKKVSVFEIEDQQNSGVGIKWICDLKDAFKSNVHA